MALRVCCRVSLLLIALALLVAGCGAAERPFDRVALIPSNWEITAVNGTTVDAETLPILAVGRSNSARLMLACGEVDLRYTSDTDGAALSFDEQRVVAACQAPADADDAAVRAAIRTVAAWHVVTDSTIELRDAAGKAVLSLQFTTCDCPHQPPATVGPASPAS